MRHFPYSFCSNVLHAFYAIAEADGLPALQRGLFPAILYQVALNGPRLGAYQVSRLHLPSCEWEFRLFYEHFLMGEISFQATRSCHVWR